MRLLMYRRKAIRQMISGCCLTLSNKHPVVCAPCLLFIKKQHLSDSRGGMLAAIPIPLSKSRNPLATCSRSDLSNWVLSTFSTAWGC